MDNVAMQRLFRFVVGRGNFWITREVQQLIAMSREAIEQFTCCFAPDRFSKKRVKTVIDLRQAPLKASECNFVLLIHKPIVQMDGCAKQLLQLARPLLYLIGIKHSLQIAQFMRQADLKYS